MKSMIEFNFENCMLTNFKDLKYQNFFKTQELLFGKSMCDIHLNDDASISNAVCLDINKIQDTSGTVFSDFLKAFPELYALHEEQKRLKKNLIVSLDFNFVSQLERAFPLNASLAINILIKKIFEINSVDYHPILSLVLPNILAQESISIILPFFCRTADEVEEVNDNEGLEICNFERFMEDERLPLKSDAEIECFQQPTFDDFNKYREEIIDKIVQRDKQKGVEGENGFERTIAVEHSFMDFQYMIIGEKIAKSRTGGDFVFDELYLSKLMIQPESNVEFYQQDAIQKIIDYQF